MNKLEDLRERKKKNQLGGGEKRIEAQHAKGKLTARERLDILFDKDSFVEIDTFVKHRCHFYGLDEKELVSDGVVTGYGQIDGSKNFEGTLIGKEGDTVIIDKDGKRLEIPSDKISKINLAIVF